MPLAQINLEYDGVAALVIGGSFMIVCYGGADGSFGCLEDLDEVTLKGQSPSSDKFIPDDLTNLTTEIWALDTDGISESQ